MKEETNLKILLSEINPIHNEGEFVFCTIDDPNKLHISDIILLFKEQEGYTVVLAKGIADLLQLNYSFVASWITLTVYSSLHAVGLTAAFSTALAGKGISCNVVAGFYHDHIFVNTSDLYSAMNVLSTLAE